jgi:hypothetical protein
MKLASLAIVALVVACATEPEPPPPDVEGTFRITWLLTDATAPAAPTCASYRIADVVLTITATASGDSHAVSFACDAGAGEVTGLALGAYRVDAQALGEHGDVAGAAQTTGSLSALDDVVTLAPLQVATAPPRTSSVTSWVLRKNGAVTSCGALPENGVRVATTPRDAAPIDDLWDCLETNTAIDVPYGPFSVRAEVLGFDNLPIGTSGLIQFDAARGTVATRVTIDVP